jgi:hypothetical protein
MMLVGLVADKARNDVIGLAAGMSGPASQRFVEIDIEHDAAEIEQQRVGGAGGEQGAGHGSRLRKLAEGSNGVTIVRSIQFADSSQIRNAGIWTGRPRRRIGLVESDQE